MATRRRRSSSTEEIRVTAVVMKREFELTLKSRKATKVCVRWGKPRLRPDGRKFDCVYRIDGLGEQPILRRIEGLDSVHALDLAMKMAMIDLVCSSHYEEGRLTWRGIFDLGLPLTEEARDRLRSERRATRVPRRQRSENNLMRRLTRGESPPAGWKPGE